MIKPDGVQRGLVGKIIERFENRGYQLVAMKLVHAGEDHLEKHYADLKGKPFFPGLIKYMTSGPVVAMVWQGKDVVKQGRVLLGATNPLASAPGTIRGDLYVSPFTHAALSMSAATSATARTRLSRPRRRLPCGSASRALRSTTSARRTSGSTSKRDRFVDVINR